MHKLAPSFLFKKLLKTGLYLPVFLAIIIFGQRASVVENITESEGLPSNYIFTIRQDQDEFLWMGSDKGLIKYFNGKFRIYDSENGLPGNYVNLILPDGKKGLLLYMVEKGLYYFDTEKEKVTVSYKNFGPKIPGFQLFTSPFDANFMILSIGNGNKLFAIHRADLLKVNKLFPKTNKDRTDYYVLDNGKEIKILDSNFDFNPKSFDDRGCKYEVNFGKGIIRYNNEKIQDTISENNGLGSNLVSNFLHTKNGDVLFSSYGGGISIIRAHNNRSLFPLNKLKVRSINYQDGKYYILSDGHLYILNRKEVLAKIFLKKDALTVFIDKENLYLGSFGGLDHYQIHQNKVRHIKFYAVGGGVSKIRKFDNKIYCSTYGGGVYSLYENSFEQKKFPIFNNVENFFQNQNQTFVITSSESGFSILDKNLKFLKNYSKKDGLLSNNISFTYGEKDTLWVGSKKGLSAIVKGKVVRSFSEDDGFKGSAVRIIFRSQKNDLWLVTDQMILKKTGNVLKPFGSLNILGDKENHIAKSSYWRNLNELAIATDKNFSLINLDAINPNENPPEPELQEIIADGSKIGKTHFLNLSAENYSTDFHFKAVDKNFLEKTGFYYKLDNEPWKPFTHYNILKFHHLDHGKHHIRVKVKNSDGYEKFYPKVFIINVLPHFYMRWWFLLGSFLLVSMSLGIIMYHYYREKYRQRIHEIQFREELENERKRISRDLHDNMGAYTTSLINKVDQMKVRVSDADQSRKLDDIRDNASYIMSLLRQTIWVLSSREISLDAFFDNFISYVQKIVGEDPQIKIKFIEEIEEERTLDSAVTISLFRILQEAFHNILKHSGATKAEFKIHSNDKIVISVKDNGNGFFEPVQNGNGLNNMKERAEEAGFYLKINSSEEGTHILIFEK